MSSFKQKLEQLRIYNCNQCGLCKADCPVYKVEGIEKFAPRARVVLTRSLLDGEFNATGHYGEIIYACLTCGACTTTCPAGVNPKEIVLAVREQLSNRAPLPRMLRFVLSRALTSPSCLQRYARAIAISQRFRPIITSGALGRVIPCSIKELAMVCPDLAPKAVLGHLPERVSATSGRPKKRVGYFLGCLQNVFFGDVVQATIKLLSTQGCEVHVFKDQDCCGLPHYTYGQPEIARAHARNNVRLFSQVELDAVITDCGSCGSMLKSYVKLLEKDDLLADEAAKFASKVRDISQFLVQDLGFRTPPGQYTAKVTYHHPCHLSRCQGITAEPVQLLSSVNGVEYIPLEESTWCCGSAGAFSFTHHETSMKILDRKMGNVAKTGAEIVASGCPSCMLQLSLGAKRKGLNVKVLHTVQILADASKASNLSISA